MKRLLLFTIFLSIIAKDASIDASIKDHTYYHLYLWAQYNQFEKNVETASQCYDFLFGNQPSHYTYPGYISYLFQTRQYDKIIPLIPIVQSILDPNLETQLIFVQSLEKMNNIQEALTLIADLVKKNPINPEVIYFATSAYARNNQIEQAIALVDTYLQETPDRTKNFLFHFLKAQLFAQVGNKKVVIKELEAALELNPNFGQGWLVLGSTHEQMGNLDQALAAYRRNLDIVGSSPLLERQIIQLQMKKHYAVAKIQEKLFNEAMQYFKLKEYKKALEISEKSLNIAAHDNTQIMKLELLCRLGKVPEALEQLKQWALVEPEKELWYKALILLLQAGVDSELIENTFIILNNESNSELALLYLTDFYLKLNSPKALTFLEKIIRTTTNKNLKVKSLLQKGQILYAKRKWDGLENLLDEGFQLDKHYPALNNLAAYYYTKVKNDTKKGQGYLDKARLHEPNNPHFLDTQALIWYKNNKLQEAEKMLRMIARNSKDRYPFKHLFKVLHRQKKYTEAKTILHQAIARTQDAQKREKYLKILKQYP